MTPNQVLDCITKNNWIFAKTMPQSPHWYTLRKQWEHDDEFTQVVKFIREYGYKEKYKKTVYTMFNINGYKYWTMGAPISETILINRARLNYENEYDAIAPVYDSLFNDPESIAENQRIISGINLSGSVLDIGCGSGVLLDTVSITDYTGIDPSKPMLNQLIYKHPDKGMHVINTKLEDYYPEIGRKYDTIVSLYGAASYIWPHTLATKIHELLADNGTLFLMFYADHYQPKSHVLGHINPSFYFNTFEGERAGNYKIVRQLSD